MGNEKTKKLSPTSSGFLLPNILQEKHTKVKKSIGHFPVFLRYFYRSYRKPIITSEKSARHPTPLLCVFLFEEGLEDFCGGDGIKAFFSFASGKFGRS